MDEPTAKFSVQRLIANSDFPLIAALSLIGVTIAITTCRYLMEDKPGMFDDYIADGLNVVLLLVATVAIYRLLRWQHRKERNLITVLKSLFRNPLRSRHNALAVSERVAASIFVAGALLFHVFELIPEFRCLSSWSSCSDRPCAWNHYIRLTQRVLVAIFIVAQLFFCFVFHVQRRSDITLNMTVGLGLIQVANFAIWYDSLLDESDFSFPNSIHNKTVEKVEHARCVCYFNMTRYNSTHENVDAMCYEGKTRLHHLAETFCPYLSPFNIEFVLLATKIIFDYIFMSSEDSHSVVEQADVSGLHGNVVSEAADGQDPVERTPHRDVEELPSGRSPGSDGNLLRVDADVHNQDQNADETSPLLPDQGPGDVDNDESHATDTAAGAAGTTGSGRRSIQDDTEGPNQEENVGQRERDEADDDPLLVDLSSSGHHETQNTSRDLASLSDSITMQSKSCTGCHRISPLFFSVTVLCMSLCILLHASHVVVGAITFYSEHDAVWYYHEIFVRFRNGYWTFMLLSTAVGYAAAWFSADNSPSRQPRRLERFEYFVLLLLVGPVTHVMLTLIANVKTPQNVTPTNRYLCEEVLNILHGTLQTAFYMYAARLTFPAQNQPGRPGWRTVYHCVLVNFAVCNLVMWGEDSFVETTNLIKFFQHDYFDTWSIIYNVINPIILSYRLNSMFLFFSLALSSCKVEPDMENVPTNRRLVIGDVTP